jgi:hypothetical protein
VVPPKPVAGESTSPFRLSGSRQARYAGRAKGTHPNVLILAVASAFTLLALLAVAWNYVHQSGLLKLPKNGRRPGSDAPAIARGSRLASRASQSGAWSGGRGGACGAPPDRAVAEGGATGGAQARVKRWTQTGSQAGETVPTDLLRLVDVGRDYVSGDWRFDQGRLVSSSIGVARILIPCVPPPEYKLTLVAEPKGKINTLVIGLVASGRQFIALLDFDVGKPERLSGLECVDGKKVFEAGNQMVFRGQALRETGPTTVVCTIREDRVLVECDGRTIIDFRGDHSRLSPNDYWAVPEKEFLFLGTYNCEYHIHKLGLTPIAAGDEPPQAEKPSDRDPPSTSAASSWLLPYAEGERG